MSFLKFTVDARAAAPLFTVPPAHLQLVPPDTSAGKSLRGRRP
jgi:hypothetical protein